MSIGCFFFCFYSLLRVEPAQRMTVIELLEHQWLNDGTVPDVPLDTPSIIVSDEVSLSKFDVVRLRGVPLSLCPSCVMHLVRRA